MQTLTLREKVGDDGILRLQVPFEPRGAEVEVVVVIQTDSKNGNAAALNKSPSWIEATYGSLQDETFEIPEDVPFEDILVFE